MGAYRRNAILNQIFHVSSEGVKHMDVLNKMGGKSGQKGFTAVDIPFSDRLLGFDGVVSLIT